MKSQDINIPAIENAAADAAYLTSVTSLVARLPAFDHVEHKKMAYMRIKSDQIVLAHHVSSEKAKTEKPDQIFILPTDDSRMRLVIIPVSEIDKV